MARRIGQYGFPYPTVKNGMVLANAHVERIAVAAKAGLQEPFENLVSRLRRSDDLLNDTA